MAAELAGAQCISAHPKSPEQGENGQREGQSPAELTSTF